MRQTQKEWARCIQDEIQKNLEIIQEQKENVNELLTDFSYKTRIFSKQASVALEQIQDIWSEKSVGKN